MSQITKEIIQQLKTNNPEHYKSFKKKIGTLKSLKKNQVELSQQIQKVVKDRIKNDQNINQNKLLELGQKLDELLEQEEHLRFNIGMDKINLNIPLSKSEEAKVGAAIKELFGKNKNEKPSNNGYSALFQDEK
tara:strand:+ start:675 stop:1073 length:399 start_codon:yes stop_codon:yes gene_type:complete